MLSYRNSQVVAVEVFPSPARPHYLARDGLQRGAYVRVGSSNRVADVALVAEMRRFSSGESYDEGPLPALDSEAVDFRAASESFAPVRTLTRRNLQTLRLLKRGDGTPIEAVGARGAATGYAIDARDRSILALLESGGELGTSEIAKAVGLSARATRTRLIKLVSRGLVHEVGTGPHDPKRRYIASRTAPGGG